MIRGACLAAVLLLGGCAAVTAGGGEAVSIPLHASDGTEVSLAGRVCRPDMAEPGRLVVIAHGSPPVASARPTMQLTSCSNEAVRWFTGRGYVVLLSLRRGYGATGGPYPETSTPCTAATYERAARVSAEDVMATVSFGLALPGVRRKGAVVVGQSAGGWAADGVDSGPHPGVAALVSMAGGRGGHMGNVPNSNCAPDKLALAAGALGRTATTPMLWVYTANDSYFAPPIAEAMHEAWTEAGGQAELVQLGPYARDGHTLFYGQGGSAIWGPVLERYLRARGAT